MLASKRPSHALDGAGSGPLADLEDIAPIRNAVHHVVERLDGLGRHLLEFRSRERARRITIGHRTHLLSRGSHDRRTRARTSDRLSLSDPKTSPSYGF